jgi:hypothetical protein
MEFFRTLVERF